MFLYVLQLVSNKWYVGTTSQTVEECFEQHQRGDGAEWTKLYKPKRIVEMNELREPWAFVSGKQMEKLSEMMLIHGVNNVRGGPFAYVRDFTEADVEHLSSMIGYSLDMNYKDLREGIAASIRCGNSPYLKCAKCGENNENNDRLKPLCTNCFKGWAANKGKAVCTSAAISNHPGSLFVINGDVNGSNFGNVNNAACPHFASSGV